MTPFVFVSHIFACFTFKDFNSLRSEGKEYPYDYAQQFLLIGTHFGKKMRHAKG